MNNCEQKKRNNRIVLIVISAAITIIGWVALSYRYDFWYQLNDDVLIKDIVSGSYSGSPDGHNIQMLYPLSFLLSLFYHLTDSISWYGMFIVFCQFFAVFLILNRTFTLSLSLPKKIVSVFALGSIFFSLYLYELVITQYTITSAFLMITACFLVYTSECIYTVKEFFKHNWAILLIVILSFSIRFNMALLLFPFFMLAMFFKYIDENGKFNIAPLKQFFAVFSILCASVIIVVILDKVAYGNSDWSVFRSFFDARTELYDFQVLPDYETNESSYKEIDVSKEQWNLLENYNFGLDESINTEFLEKVVNLTKNLKANEFNLKESLTKSWDEYKYLSFHADSKWTYLIFFLYMCWGISIFTKKKGHFYEVILLFLCRTAIWFYILLNGRAPDRITHPLYLVEIILLISILLKRNVNIAVCCGVVLYCVCLLPSRINYLNEDIAVREELLEEYVLLKDYVYQHPDCFYYLDVYSSVCYSEKIFGNEINTIYPSNMDIMGGWASKSPLDYKKRNNFGFSNLEKALINDNVFFIVRTPDDISELEWISLYYEDHNVSVNIYEEDVISHNSHALFTVYSINQGLITNN